MAKTATPSTRLERIQAARMKLAGRVNANHPKSKAYKARIAEYDEAEKRLKAKSA